MKVRFAEWILSLVLPPERAVSTVGDWMEDASERGPVWFWSCVFQTVAAGVWRDLAASPAKMARLGLTGFALNMLVPLGFAILIIAAAVSSHGDIRYRHDWLWTLVMTNTAKSPSLPPHFEMRWPFSLFWALRVFQTGRWIARHAPRREMAACVAVALAGWTFIVVTEVLALRSANEFAVSPSAFPMGIVHDIILFSAAVWTGRNRVAHMG